MSKQTEAWLATRQRTLGIKGVPTMVTETLTEEKVQESPAPTQRKPGRPAGSGKDPLELFANMVGMDDHGHLLWLGSFDRFGQPQMAFKKTTRNAKYVAYCLLTEDVDYLPGDRYVSECCMAECVDPECIFKEDADQILPKCGNWWHDQDTDWSFKVNGIEICRGCAVYYWISNGSARQVDHLLDKGCVQERDWEAVTTYLINPELMRYPGLFSPEAERVLKNYLRNQKKAGKDILSVRVERLQRIIEGDYEELLSGDWAPEEDNEIMTNDGTSK